MREIEIIDHRMYIYIYAYPGWQSPTSRFQSSTRPFWWWRASRSTTRAPSTLSATRFCHVSSRSPLHPRPRIWTYRSQRSCTACCGPRARSSRRDRGGWSAKSNKNTPARSTFFSSVQASDRRWMFCYATIQPYPITRIVSSNRTREIESSPRKILDPLRSIYTDKLFQLKIYVRRARNLVRYQLRG